MRDLATLDPSDVEGFVDGSISLAFARLRDDAPVHLCRESPFGPYWSVTRYDDIVGVEKDHERFSSSEGIALHDLNPERDERFPMFIAMDPPAHTARRRITAGALAGDHLQHFAASIRDHTAATIDALPRNEPFDWVARVSKELTAHFLATLLGVPHDDRHQLIAWSDLAASVPSTPAARQHKRDALQPCMAYLAALREQRLRQPREHDLVSPLLLGAEDAPMGLREFIGTLVLLIVGGNDTTRNAMTGSAVFFDQHRQEYARLLEDRNLLANATLEILRYQTPIAYMRRVAKQDVELHGKTIRRGEKVVLWYLSANRDERVFDAPDDFRIARANARRHLSFGHGIHRCVGARLAELQVQTLWETLTSQGLAVRMTSPPTRAPSSFSHGYLQAPVQLVAA